MYGHRNMRRLGCFLREIFICFCRLGDVDFGCRDSIGGLGFGRISRLGSSAILMFSICFRLSRLRFASALCLW